MTQEVGHSGLTPACHRVAMTAEILALTPSHPEFLLGSDNLTHAQAMGCWSSCLEVAHMSMNLDTSLTKASTEGMDLVPIHAAVVLQLL